ncbi:pep-cterm sorting domain-containing protein [Anaeramoeba ignava]|uniref:Pep-cterm sorting domain-containing protein n=1 Tax=Anaeramoeba ignava TaxID=1746090 RepID=A0A9Q0LWT4_ANAIG|nr:pep-cterm sorting domain-containing protein [Anaeramoeba ignava]
MTEMPKENKIQIISSFILAGADPTIPNNLQAFQLTDDPEIQILLFFTLVQDYLQFFDRQELCDFDFETREGKVCSHKLILENRIGKNLENLKLISIKKEKKELEIFLKWIYSGNLNFAEFPNSQNLIFKIGEEIGMSAKEIESKSNLVGLQKSFLDLYSQNESKNFKIIKKDESKGTEKSFLAHKEVLAARSGFFRGMFVSVQDESNQVTDLSMLSIKSMEIFLKFLYCNELDVHNIPKNLLQEIEEAMEFFQVSESPNLIQEKKSKQKKQLNTQKPQRKDEKSKGCSCF